MFLARWLHHRRKAVLMSGVLGAPARYRSEHQAEEFRILGWSARFVPLSRIEEISRNPPNLIILHRVRFSPSVALLMEAARRQGSRVLYDIDDRIFDKEHLRDLRERDLELHAGEWLSRLQEHKQAMKRCDGVLVSTDALAEEAQRVVPGLPVTVHRNAVSATMIRDAEKALQRERIDPSILRMGYFSGSETHDVDFLACAGMLPGLFETHPSLRLLIVGPLFLPEYLKRYASQIERKDFVPWRELPSLYRMVDIAIAPLEMPSLFTEAKSENKYLEAGLMEVPLIASPTESFRQVIRHGENGMLARTPAEWFAAADTLIRDRERRHRIGQRAREDILQHATTEHRAGELKAALQKLSIVI